MTIDKLKEVLAHRWLGYVQGALRAAGICTIRQLRAHNRSNP